MSTRRAGVLQASLQSALMMLLSACSQPENPRQKPSQSFEELPPGVELTVRGNQEVVLLDDGSLRPRWFGSKQPIGICLDAPIEIDTSQWQVRLTFAGRPSAEFIDQPLQAGTTSCFAQPAPPDLESTPDLEVCATLRDGFDDRHYRLPCFRVAFDADDSAFGRELAAAHHLISELTQQPTAAGRQAIDQLADGLIERGYLLVGASLRLMNVHQLLKVGTTDAHAEVRRRLDAAPAWSIQPAATVLHAKLKLDRAKLELAEGRTQFAWQLLSEADALTRKVAARERLAVAIIQVGILGRLGAGGESIARLHAALDDCRTGACRQSLINSARQLLGWLLLNDPDASARDLDRAEDNLETTGDGDDDLERANRRLNAALLAIRRGQDPGQDLDQARATLTELEPSARQQDLQAWGQAFAGFAALAAGDAGSAVEHCAAAALATPRIAARGWSCVGQAERQRGNLDGAASAFDQAILHHTLALPDASGLSRPPAPGQRVDDSYSAARVAVERGDPTHAWQLLEALDASALELIETCDARTAIDIQQHESRRHELLTQLAWTEPPLAPQRQQQVAPIRRSIQHSLAELQRDLLANCQRPLQASPVAADVHAFALEDEVLALWRSADGSLMAQRTSLPRRELKRRIEELAEAQHSGQLDDAAWRALAGPIAEALLPDDPESLGVITHFALHGVLQRVPLPALPLANGDGRRWLADVTTAVVRPPYVGPASSRPSSVLSEPLFIVDPRRNLPSGTISRDTYRRRFPTARVLFGSEASVEAVRAALPSASFLHVDAHGQYDSTFPELSSLEMADGDLIFGDFATLARLPYLANLSGCHTGFSRPTGGSGHDGLAGVLTRRGTRWVIAHQSATHDRLSHDFNKSFYRKIEAGSGVVEAYRAALFKLRLHYPAAAWSNLTLFGTDEGKNQPLVTTKD